MVIDGAMLKYIWKMAKLIIPKKVSYPFIPAVAGVYIHEVPTDTGSELIAETTNGIESVYVKVKDFSESTEVKEPFKALISLDNLKYLADIGQTIALYRENGMVYAKTNSKVFSVYSADYEELLDAHPWLEAKDIPENALPVDKTKLQETLKTLRFSMGTDSFLQNLYGVYMEPVDDKLRFVSSDGYRLTMCDLSTTNGIEHPAVLIRNPFIEILTALKKFTLHIDKNTLFATTTAYVGDKTYFDVETTFVSKAADYQYPDYRKVLPESRKHIMVFDTLDITKAVEKAVKSKVDRVELVTYEDQLGVCYKTGESYVPILERLSTNLQFSVWVNPEFLLETLRACDTNEINAVFNDRNEPIELYWEDKRHILMPIRS